MKVFTVTGTTGTGKTTTIENLIKELNRRGFSVGTVKEIHYENFAIDTPGKNTYRHRAAGADTVVALGMNETDVMYKGKMNIYDILRHFKEDFVILEGVTNVNAPRIAVAMDKENLIIDDRTILISGKIANEKIQSIDSIPVLSALDSVKEIVDLILKYVPELMPDMDIKCCNECGKGCRGLLSAILKGEAKREDCILNKSKVKLEINGKMVDVVPFVDNILYNTVIGVVKELKGYKNNSEIIIKI